MLRAGDHDVVVSEPVIVGLVLLAKEAGRISAARPLIRRLRESGMYLSDLVVNEALARVGE
jgi:predicted nucleic acid-binding protein